MTHGLTPEIDAGDDDLDQSDTHPTAYPAIAVSIEGIARVRSLPARRAILGRAYVPPDGQPHRLVGRNDARLSVAITPRGADLDVYAVEPAAGATSGHPLPDGVPLGLDYTGELWAINSGAETATVGVVQILAEE